MFGHFSHWKHRLMSQYWMVVRLWILWTRHIGNWWNSQKNSRKAFYWFFLKLFLFIVIYYEVETQTGDLWGAESNAEVFVNIIGERGDTGERRLVRRGRYTFKKNQVMPSVPFIFTLFLFFPYSSQVKHSGTTLRFRSPVEMEPHRQSLTS